MTKDQLKIYNKIRDEVQSRGKKVEFCSYSKLQTYIQCPLQYKFKYIDRIKSDFKANIYSDIGGLTHELTEKYLSQTEVSKKEILDEFQFQSNHFFNLHGLSREHNLNKSLTHYFKYSTFLEENKYSSTKKIFELPIYIRLKSTEKKEYWFVGFIDMVEENEKGEVTLYDFKISHRSGYTGKKLETAAVQLYIYAYIYQLLYNKNVKHIKYLFMKFCNIEFKDNTGKTRKTSNIERCYIKKEFEEKGGKSDLVVSDNFIELSSDKETIEKYVKGFISTFINTLSDKKFDHLKKDESYCLKFCEYRKSGHCTKYDEEPPKENILITLYKKQLGIL